MKIDRLIGILSILLKHGKVTAPYLADKFEVSRRTINRDIENLCMAGIPLITTQGSGGGITIADGYKIDKTLLTSQDMQAILAGLKSLDSVAGNNDYKRLMEKLNGDISNISRNEVYDSSGHILIDLSSHYKGTLAPKIESIRDAIIQKRLVSFTYYYPKGESARLIEPYLLIFEWSNWYVWGFCRERMEMRMFKLNRLWNLQIVEEEYSPRELPSYQKQRDDYFSNLIHLIVEVDSDMKWKLVEEYGVDSFTMNEAGNLLFETHFTNKENLITWMLSFGCKANIIEPDWIREEFI